MSILGTLGLMGAQTGMNILGGMFSGGQSWKKSMELAKYGYQKDLEMWNRMNAYNTPEAQMKRLESAGLNPAMMYGTPTSGNISGQMPHFNAPQARYDYQMPQIIGVLSQYQDIKVKEAQEEYIRSQTVGKGLENKLKEGTLSYSIRKALYDLNIKISEARLNEIVAGVEDAIVTRYGSFDSEGNWGYQYGVSPQADNRIAEIQKTQAEASQSVSNAVLKALEADMYKILKTVGAGSQAGRVIGSIIQGFIRRK